MAVVSKLQFREAITDPAITCSALIHPWTASCTKAHLRIAIALIKGSAKFYLPIYVLQLIFRGKKTNKEFLKELFLKCYPRSILYAIVYGWTFYAANCILRAYTGTFHYYNIGFASGFIGGLAIFVESNRYKYLNTVLYFNLIVETIIRLLHNKNKITKIPVKETVVFMICSAILMYIKTGRNVPTDITNLWFYTPSKIYPSCENDSNDGTIIINKCFHMRDYVSCLDYIVKGSYDYFRIGYGLQIAKSFIGKYDQIVKSPKKLMTTLFNKRNVRFGCFLGGYATIYRLLCCYLRKKDKKEKRIHTLIAGFLAGSTYILEPNLGFAVIAITTILQIQLAKLRKKGYVKNQLFLTQLLFAACSGLLFHYRFLHSDSCPSYIPNMLKTFSGGLVDGIYKHVLSFLPEHSQILK